MLGGGWWSFFPDIVTCHGEKNPPMAGFELATARVAPDALYHSVTPSPSTINYYDLQGLFISLKIYQQRIFSNYNSL